MAQRWRQAGADVFALGRNPDTAGNAIRALQADLDRPETLADLPSTAALIYYFAPPPAEGERDTRLENFLAAIPADALPRRIVYISTSGVYGDCQGAWVTEQTPPQPGTGRAKRRLAAERALRAWAQANRVSCVILRVGGIYGPGRLPLKRLRQGMPVLRRDLAPPTNRIHAEDLAQACQAAATAPGESPLYNVCDNQASTMSDYFIAVAEQAGLPRPGEIDWRQAEAELSPAMLSYLRESRRMDNSKMLRELNIELAYPTLREGLAACFEAEEINPF